MSFELKTKKLSEISNRIFSGATPNRNNQLYWENGSIPWLKTNQLGSYKIYNTEEKISLAGLEETSTKLAKRNTISVAMYGDGKTRGSVSILAKDMTTNQACCNIEVNEKVADYKYVYYHLKQNYLTLRHFSNGGAQQNLSVGFFKEFVINCPELQIQKNISEILSRLDDKIELNNRMNKVLEQMAQAIFKQWFVDFEFPNENGDPYKSIGGEMEWCEELGKKIPKGWKLGTLSELVKVKYGKDHKKLADGNIPVFGSGGIMRFVDTSLYSSESVLIPRKGTLNNVFYVSEPFWSVDTMFYTEMKIPKIAIFVYLFMKEKDLSSMNVGSAVPSMTTEILNNLPVIIAPLNIFDKFNEIVSGLFDQIKIKQKFNSVLAKTRDTLLPKLMSGELDVSEIEL